MHGGAGYLGLSRAAPWEFRDAVCHRRALMSRRATRAAFSLALLTRLLPPLAGE